MRKIAVFLTFFLFVAVASAWAQQSNDFTLPDKARKVSENVYYLGKGRDPQTNLDVEGYAIVHRGRGYDAKPDHAGGPGGGGTSSCYGFLANGAKWKIVEPWIMNPANSSSLDSPTLFNIMDAAVTQWESAASYNILGDGSTTANILIAETSGSPDGSNEVYFAGISDSNAIAVTIVWGIFGGPPRQRQLVEWDMIFDDVDYNWSAEANGVACKMDFDNIATHELGHSVGLNDLYEPTCFEQTMYGYADYGDTNKRTLESGDIAGIQALY
ncbi:hypothetical protein A3G65_01275 [Candidatus Roizmanbacteria bacterium RIFCSPLOWO2_12_FULL_37_7b]|nr:MAG: hypothetical protein A3G65_01275 [Candidatus Roizmanbacteria bacterium RIFCSPLOWO2_12_FULL_37_7b]